MKEFKSYFKEDPKPKKEKRPLKRTRIKYKKKDTGQISVFEDIAESRDWVCFVTGKRLNQLTATNFGHVLPKALNKYPLYKTFEKNIVLVTDEIHFLWDHTPRSELLAKEPRFQKMFELEDKLKAQYPKII